MFEFIKKKRETQDALSNLKTVTRWLKSLPTGDIYSAQEQVVKNLIRFNHGEAAPSKDRLLALMHLDEQTRDIQSSLCQQYLRNPRMSRSMEAKLWTTIHAFYWEITRGYHGFLMTFVANPGGSKIQPHIPVITARAIRGFADIIKWRYFRYEAVDEKLWLRLHNLYRVAEFDNFSEASLSVYPHDSGKHSPAHEYGQALLLSPFGSGSLLPRQVEMVDQWLDNWSDVIHVDRDYDAERHSFFIENNVGYGLKRCRDQGNAPTRRFLSTQALVTRIDEVTESLRRGAVPVTLGLTEDFRLPEGYKLLEAVKKEWKQPDAFDRRNSSRVPESGQWMVIHDLANICNELAKPNGRSATGAKAQLSPEEILDIKLYGFVTERTKERLLEREQTSNAQAQHALWAEVDSSDGGLGFSVEQNGGDWVKVGRLIAASRVGEHAWRLGVVGRLARANGGRHAGIRLLDGDIRAVTLKLESQDSDAGYVVDDPEHGGSHCIRAILLTGDDKSERLLLESAHYARDRKFTLRSDPDSSRLVRLGSVEETGDSWLKLDFETTSA